MDSELQHSNNQHMNFVSYVMVLNIDICNKVCCSCKSSRIQLTKYCRALYQFVGTSEGHKIRRADTLAQMYIVFSCFCNFFCGKNGPPLVLVRIKQGGQAWLVRPRQHDLTFFAQCCTGHQMEIFAQELEPASYFCN